MNVRPCTTASFVSPYRGRRAESRRDPSSRTRPREATAGQGHPAGTAKSKDDGKRVPLDVKAGDLILFGKYSGQEIKLDGEEFLIMREDEVLLSLKRRHQEKEVGDDIGWPKQIVYGEQSARRSCAASNQLADAVKVTLGPKAANVVPRQENSARRPSPRTA